MEETNSTKFGTFVADAMELMERDFPDSSIRNIGLIVEFDNHEARTSTTRFLSTSDSNNEQIGMVTATLGRLLGVGPSQ